MNWRTIRPCLWWAGALAVLAGAHATAQDFDPVEDAGRTRALTSLSQIGFDPWSDPSGDAYVPQTAGDSDLGEQLVLMPAGGHRPFTFRLTQRGVWTSNAALTETDELEDFYWNTDLSLNYLPKLVGNTYGELNANYALYRYTDHSRLDFDSLEASAGLIHVFRNLDDLSGWFRYNHTRYLSGRGHDEIFTDHGLEVGLYYPLRFGPRHFAYGSVTSEFSIDGDPGFAARHEHGLSLGYQYTPTERIEFSTSYRLYLQNYTEADRDDVLHHAGVGLTYRLTDWADLGLTGSYSLNESDLDGGDYEAGDLGAFLGLKLLF